MWVFTGLIASGLMVPTSAIAKGKQALIKSSFADSEDIPYRQLDWTQPSTELRFNIPEDQFIDGLEFLLTARPVGIVDGKTPLMVQYNDAAPVPLHTNGRGFDARIKLDTKAMRPRNNILRLSYPTPKGAQCLREEDGQWQVDMTDSLMVLKARSKTHAPNLQTIRTRLSAMQTAPKTVAILASGPNSTALEALSAQGIALNMAKKPDFKLTANRTDFVIRVGTRTALRKLGISQDALSGNGPHITAARAAKPTLIITGDTQDELLRAAKAFASAPIPDTRNRDTSIGDFLTMPVFGTRVRLSSGKTALKNLGKDKTTDSWAATPLHYRFDVTDPAASRATLSLKLRGGAAIASGSVLKATFNGNPLGSVAIKRGTHKVTFDLPAGTLNGINNHLILTPHLIPAEGAIACDGTGRTPGFSISDKSMITLENEHPSSQTDLSRFAATGSVFTQNDGKNTIIALANTRPQDRAAALKIMAQIAHIHQGGLGQARIIDQKDLPENTTANVLFIGANPDFEHALFAQAPRALLTAVSPSRAKAAIRTRQARLRSVSQRALSTRPLVQGGVAALFQAPNQPDQFVGVITRSPSRSFSHMTDSLLDMAIWNRLEGSVARWNDTDVFMAQTAFTRPQAKSRGHAIFAKFKPDLRMPEIKLPKWNWPEVTMPKLSLPKLSVPWKEPEDKDKEIAKHSETDTPKTTIVSSSPAPSIAEVGPILSAQTTTLAGGHAVITMTDITPRLKPTHPASLIKSTSKSEVKKEPSAASPLPLRHQSEAMFEAASHSIDGVFTRLQPAISETSSDKTIQPRVLVFALISVLILILTGLLNPGRTPTEKR